MREKVLALPFVLIAVCGCGGGGSGSSSAPPAGGTDFSFATLEGRAALTNPPLTTSSANITATGLKGTITALRLKDQQPDPSELRLLFTSDVQTSISNMEVYSCNLDGSDLVRITNTPAANELDAIGSPDGRRIAFVAVGTGGDHEVFMMNSDGSGRVQLTDNDGFDAGPRWHPSGNNIVFYVDGKIMSVNVNTKVVTPLVADGFSSTFPDYSADGSRVIFQSSGRSGDGFTHLYVVPSVGGAVSPFFLGIGASQFTPKFGPDGSFFAYKNTATGKIETRTLNLGAPIEGPSSNEYNWSPDGKKFVYNPLATNDLFISDLDGTGAVEILGNITAAKVKPCFLPAPKEVNFVGAGSLFGSRLAGMIFSQNGPSVRGLLGFDADTPTSVVLTKQTPDNAIGPNLVFSVDADSVREISYAHAPYWRPFKVVGAGTTVPTAAGALVSIDSLTGRIVAVLPFSGSRAGKATFHDEGSTRVFTGNFLGAFDRQGANQGSATEVRLNMQTGELSAG